MAESHAFYRLRHRCRRWSRVLARDIDRRPIRSGASFWVTRKTERGFGEYGIVDGAFTTE